MTIDGARCALGWQAQHEFLIRNIFSSLHKFPPFPPYTSNIEGFTSVVPYDEQTTHLACVKKNLPIYDVNFFSPLDS